LAEPAMIASAEAERTNFMTIPVVFRATAS